MAHVLVTGGAGFLGSHFVTYWLGKYRSDTVTILDSLDTGSVFDNVSRNQAQFPGRCLFIKADITDYPSIDKIFRAATFDIVINFAAMSSQDRALQSPQDCQRINLGGVITLFECARTYRVPRFHHISTCEVYGPLGDGALPFTEESPLHPSSPYNIYKAEADKYLLRACRNQETFTTISRSCNNYGPYQHLEKLIPRLVTNLLGDEKIILHAQGKHAREWIHATDYMRALDLILHKGQQGEIYNVGTGEEANLNDIADIVLSKLGLTASQWLEYGPDRPRNDQRYLLNSSKIRALGWEPRVTLRGRNGLEATITWYAKHREWWAPLRQTPVGRTPAAAAKSKLHELSIEPTHILHRDARRTLYGIALRADKIDEDQVSILDAQIIEVHASKQGPAVLGEHYHDHAEVLHVLDGHIDACTLEDVDTKEQLVLTGLPAHTKLYIPPRVAHRLVFSQPSKLLYINEENHDRTSTNKAYKMRHIRKGM